MVALAIGGTELIDEKVVVGFSGWFLWKDLIKFLRYLITEMGF